MIRAVIALVLAACSPRPERIVAAPDAGTAAPAYRAVEIDRSRVLLFDLRGPDFEDARERSCPLEAVIDAPDAGQPVLRFRCAAYAGP